ncbi:MAG: hypothetical protein ACJAW3_001628 [Lentimonas sp.]|jgi:hypothetical protein
MIKYYRKKGTQEATHKLELVSKATDLGISIAIVFSTLKGGGEKILCCRQYAKIVYGKYFFYNEEHLKEINKNLHLDLSVWLFLEKNNFEEG